MNRLRNLFLASVLLVGMVAASTENVHATPPTHGCLGTWVGAHGTGGDWTDIAGKRFHTDDYLNYQGTPDGSGGCNIQFAWEEIAYQWRNGGWSSNVDIFQYHHLRFRVWICGGLVQDNNANVAYYQTDSGWVYSQTFHYPAGCGPQADNYGYAGNNSGSYINEDGIGVTPIWYVNYSGW